LCRIAGDIAFATDKLDIALLALEVVTLCHVILLLLCLEVQDKTLRYFAVILHIVC
jgi:hypothetical protein